MWLCDQRSVTPAFLTLIFEGFNQKAFFEEWYWFQLNKLEFVLGIAFTAV